MRKFYAELKTSQKTDLPQSTLIYTYSSWYTKLLLWRVTSNLQRPKKWIFLLFDGNRLWWGSSFLWFFIFCLHRALYKIHTWKLFAHGKIKSRRKSLVEKKIKKKFWTKEERKKEYHSVKKRKKFFMTATSTGEALCWSPGFQHRSRCQTEIYHT